jgi:hypothetical protein
MSEKKDNNILHTLWHSFRKNKDLDNVQAMPDFGIDIVKTDGLDTRLTRLQDLNAYIQQVIEKKEVGEDGKVIDARRYTPEERLHYYRRAANGINTRIQMIAIPWGGGGEAGWYAELAMAWSTLFTWCLITIDSLERLMESEKGRRIDKDTLINKLDFYFSQVIIWPSYLMLAFSWKSRDVVPQQMAMIQNLPQFGQNQPYPRPSNIPFNTGGQQQ